MAKTYTVSGESKTRPTDLPDGLTVEETEAPFNVTIEAGDESGYTLRVSEESVGESLQFEPLDEDGSDNSYVFLRRTAVAKLRDVLTEWLDDGKSSAPAVVDEGDPEPPHDAVYVDIDGDEVSHDGASWGWKSKSGTWYPYDKYEYVGSFPWYLKP
jgi:hypothetical protein